MLEWGGGKPRGLQGSVGENRCTRGGGGGGDGQEGMQGGEQARHPIWVNALSPLDGHDGESTWQWRNTAGR